MGDSRKPESADQKIAAPATANAEAANGFKGGDNLKFKLLLPSEGLVDISLQYVPGGPGKHGSFKILNPETGKELRRVPPLKLKEITNIYRDGTAKAFESKPDLANKDRFSLATDTNRTLDLVAIAEGPSSSTFIEMLIATNKITNKQIEQIRKQKRNPQTTTDAKVIEVPPALDPHEAAPPLSPTATQTTLPPLQPQPMGPQRKGALSGKPILPPTPPAPVKEAKSSAAAQKKKAKKIPEPETDFFTEANLELHKKNQRNKLEKEYIKWLKAIKKSKSASAGEEIRTLWQKCRVVLTDINSNDPDNTKHPKQKKWLESISKKLNQTYQAWDKEWGKEITARVKNPSATASKGIIEVPISKGKSEKIVVNMRQVPPSASSSSSRYEAWIDASAYDKLNFDDKGWASFARQELDKFRQDCPTQIINLDGASKNDWNEKHFQQTLLICVNQGWQFSISEKLRNVPEYKKFIEETCGPPVNDVYTSGKITKAQRELLETSKPPESAPIKSEAAMAFENHLNTAIKTAAQKDPTFKPPELLNTNLEKKAQKIQDKLAARVKALDDKMDPNKSSLFSLHLAADQAELKRNLLQLARFQNLSEAEKNTDVFLNTTTQPTDKISNVNKIVDEAKLALNTPNDSSKESKISIAEKTVSTAEKMVAQARTLVKQKIKECERELNTATKSLEDKYKEFEKIKNALDKKIRENPNLFQTGPILADTKKIADNALNAKNDALQAAKDLPSPPAAPPSTPLQNAVKIIEESSKRIEKMTALYKTISNQVQKQINASKTENAGTKDLNKAIRKLYDDNFGSKMFGDNLASKAAKLEKNPPRLDAKNSLADASLDAILSAARASVANAKTATTALTASPTPDAFKTVEDSIKQAHTSIDNAAVLLKLREKITNLETKPKGIDVNLGTVENDNAKTVLKSKYDILMGPLNPLIEKAKIALSTLLDTVAKNPQPAGFSDAQKDVETAIKTAENAIKTVEKQFSVITKQITAQVLAESKPKNSPDSTVKTPSVADSKLPQSRSKVIIKPTGLYEAKLPTDNINDQQLQQDNKNKYEKLPETADSTTSEASCPSGKPV